MSTTPFHARGGRQPKRDSLRSTALGAIWEGLPWWDRQLLLWLQSADIVTSGLAAVLVYGPLRTAQRRLARLVELGILRGFWASNSHRPRGRHAFVLRRAARLDLERLMWPEGRRGRGPEMPSSAAIHQLATHDLLAAFLRAADPEKGEGIFAWIPERAVARLFHGYLRPDAVAGFGLATGRSPYSSSATSGPSGAEDLPDKIGRYCAVFARAPELAIRVGFVGESRRRARTIQDLARRGQVPPSRLRILTAIDEALRTDPLGSSWNDGERSLSTREPLAVGAKVSPGRSSYPAYSLRPAGSRRAHLLS
jgi:hypothetical protein